MPTRMAMKLPAGIKPYQYTLTIAPNLNDFTFQGKETIDIVITESTSEIRLHCVELKIESCEFTDTSKSTLIPCKTILDPETGTITFKFPSNLPKGNATISLVFTGELNEKLRGFYRSSYTDTQGSSKYIATTQFEPTDARRAFPCWDEPDIKAKFRLTLLVPNDVVAISNMPILSESYDSPNIVKKEFQETPLMSTYLLAFIVGDLQSIERKTIDGTLIRVWARPGKEQEGQFALDVSEQLLAYFNKYFGIHYPLGKLDHIAIPDFAAGAMENWGAITYRESAILVNPKNSSAATKQNVASIIAHEMAHMWFGDLVTMKWWNDLWLNESFASWMGDKAVDHLFPEWEIWTQFVSYETNKALELDGLENSRPIEQDVTNPAQIGQLFDAISYSKGGSILRMLERYIGDDVFRRGLQKYIQKYRYNNATTVNLWSELGEVSGKPVEDIMNTWVKQTGYPVLNVRTESSKKVTRITTTQSRFMYNHILDNQISEKTSQWYVPLLATNQETPISKSFLMNRRKYTFTIPKKNLATKNIWTKINPDQTGFYRVNYSEDDWNNIRGAVENMLLTPVDRLGVQNDAYSLCKAGYMYAAGFLKLTKAYNKEVNASVWADLTANLRHIDRLVGGESYHTEFQLFAKQLLGHIAKVVGWDTLENDNHLTILLRSTILSELGKYGDKETLECANKLFSLYVENDKTVRADIQSVVFTLAAIQGDEELYHQMWSLRDKVDSEEGKTRFLNAITQFKVPKLIDDTLDRSLTDKIRFHETISVITSIASSKTGLDHAWKFTKDNWSEINQRYGEGGFGLMKLVGMVSRFTTVKGLEDVSEFFKSNPVPAADRTVRQSLEEIKLNIAWIEKNRENLATWFGN